MTNSISNKPQRASGTQQRIVLLYEDAAQKASAWQKSLRHAEREAGRLMREEREMRGISLRKMAELLSISPPHLSDMENGNRRYSPAWVTEAMSVFEQNPGVRGRESSSVPCTGVVR